MIRNPCFLGWFSLPFSNKARKKDQGACCGLWAGKDSRNHLERGVGLKGIAKGGVTNRNKGGCKRLFGCFCPRLLAFACVLASAFACVCPRLSAFAYVCSHLLYAPLCCLPLCVIKWPGDSQRDSGRFARIDSCESTRREPLLNFITCERFARIASNLRIASFSPPQRDPQKRGSVPEP